MLVKKPNNPSIYFRFYMYIALSISMTILVVTIVLFFNFQNIGQSLLYASAKDSLTQVSYSSTFMTQSVKSIASQLYFGKETSKLLYSNNMSSSELNFSLSQIKIFRATSPMIHSVYFYNGDNGAFYTNLLNRVYTKEDFFDKEIVSILDNFPKDMKLMPIPRKISSSFLFEDSDMSANVYTYVFFDEPLRDFHVRRAVIINISEEWIRETIRSMSTDSNSSIFIINDAGMTVSGNSTTDLLTDLSDKDYVQDILKSTQHSNYGLYTIAGVKTLVSFVKSSVLNWTFVRLTPVNIINNQLRTIQLTSLIFCILILIIGFFFSHLMTRNLYKPVKVILTKLQSLDSEMKKNLYQLKQDFLNRLLNGSLNLSFEEFQGRCTEYYLPFKALDDFSLVIFKIDNYSTYKNDFNIEERALIKFNICTIVAQIASEAFVAEAVDLPNDLIGLIYTPASTKDPENSSNKSVMNGVLKSIQENVFSQIHVSLSATTFDKKDVYFSDISSLYNTLVDYSSYRLFFNHRCIIYVEDIHILENEHYVYPSNKEKLFFDALLAGKYELAKDLVDELLSTTNGYSYMILKSTVLRFVFSLSITLDSIKKTGSISTTFDINSLPELIINLETLTDIKDTLYILIEQVIMKIDGKKKNMNSDIVEKVVETIHSKYMDLNLTPDLISESMSMSTLYLSRLFKKQTTQSIANYINDVRLEKAKELLLGTEESIKDIVTLCGFSNSNYFFTLFKKSNGLTPNDFRRNNLLSKN